MTAKHHAWISIWFMVVIPIILFDAAYCFLRPRSMKGGDLHWMWKSGPFEVFQGTNHPYGLKAFQEGDGFANAQSLLNVIETLVNITYLYLTHVSPSSFALVIGLSAAVMTSSKTLLYFAQEFYCGFCAIRQMSVPDILSFWVLPCGLWIVVPALIAVQLGKDLSASVRAADRASRNSALGKIRWLLCLRASF